jgi:CRISPR-associated endonuclease Cas1
MQEAAVSPAPVRQGANLRTENAMLNYGLAVLESQVRMAVVAAGLDPTIGYFHERYGGKQTLALDLMELKRPLVDRAVREFAKAHAFSAGDVTLLDGRVCRLKPQAARNIVALVSKQLEASGAAGALLSFIIWRSRILTGRLRHQDAP